MRAGLHHDELRYSAKHFAFFTPIVGLHLGCVLVFYVGTSAIATLMFVAISAVQVLGITLGYHRLLAHRSFKTSRPPWLDRWADFAKL